LAADASVSMGYGGTACHGRDDRLRDARVS
jgi:hypothetical protein